jgi:TrmH family RNA methyltransferase
MILLPGTGDPSNPKVVRAAMGASFRLPIARASNLEFSVWAREHAVAVWVAETDGVALERVERQNLVAIVVGNEGSGVKQSVRNLAHQRVAVPLARGAESLNVAVAAGIILHEVTRAD